MYEELKRELKQALKPAKAPKSPQASPGWALCTVCHDPKPRREREDVWAWKERKTCSDDCLRRAKGHGKARRGKNRNAPQGKRPRLRKAPVLPPESPRLPEAFRGWYQHYSNGFPMLRPQPIWGLPPLKELRVIGNPAWRFEDERPVDGYIWRCQARTT